MLGLWLTGAAAASSIASAEPRGTFELQGGFQLGASHSNDGPSGYAPAPMFAVEGSLHVVHGVSAVAAWGGAMASDNGQSAGLAVPYVGLRWRFGSARTIELELGATLPMRDLDEGDRCVQGLNEPPGSHVYSGCRGPRGLRGGPGQTDSALYRAALGRGYRDPWLWAVDWNSTVAQLRVTTETELGPVELEAFGVVAFDRNSDDTIGVLAVAGELRPRCYGVGFTAAQVVGDETMTQLAGRVRLLRHDGPTTYELRLDVPVPEPEYTALSVGVARTF